MTLYIHFSFSLFSLSFSFFFSLSLFLSLVLSFSLFLFFLSFSLFYSVFLSFLFLSPVIFFSDRETSRFSKNQSCSSTPKDCKWSFAEGSFFTEIFLHPNTYKSITICQRIKILFLKVQEYSGSERHSSDWLCWQRRCCLLGDFFDQEGWQEDRRQLLPASFVLRRWLGLARLLPATKTESIQLPDDGEIDTETLSPVSLYNCINSFLQPPLLIFLPHQPWQEMPYRRFLVSFWEDLLSHGVAPSHPLLRGQTRGVGLLPPIEIETADGHSAPPDVSRNCVAKRRGQFVFGSLVCPGGGQGGWGAGNLSRFSSEPSCGHGSALSHWMGRLSRQNFWGIQYSS